MKTYKIYTKSWARMGMGGSASFHNDDGCLCAMGQIFVQSGVPLRALSETACPRELAEILPKELSSFMYFDEDRGIWEISWKWEAFMAVNDSFLVPARHMRTVCQLAQKIGKCVLSVNYDKYHRKQLSEKAEKLGFALEFIEEKMPGLPEAARQVEIWEVHPETWHSLIFQFASGDLNLDMPAEDLIRAIETSEETEWSKSCWKP